MRMFAKLFLFINKQTETKRELQLLVNSPDGHNVQGQARQSRESGVLLVCHLDTDGAQALEPSPLLS